MKEIIKFIKEKAKYHGVNIYDIKLQFSPEGFLIVWNHLEGGTQEDDLWEVLDSFNERNIDQVENNNTALQVFEMCDDLIKKMDNPSQSDIIDLLLDETVKDLLNDISVMNIYKILKTKLNKKKVSLM